jgi:microcin C transport system permease protein
MRLNKDLQVKLKRFRRDRRAFYSFLFITIFFLVSLPAEWLCNVRPVLLSVDGRLYFPILFSYSEKNFGGDLLSEPDYKSERFMQLISGKNDTTQAINELLMDFEDEDPPGDNLGLDLGDFEDEENEESTGLSLDLGDFEDEESSAPSSPAIRPKNAETLGEQPKGERDFWILWPIIPYDYKYIPSQSLSGRVVLAAPYETLSYDGKETIDSSFRDKHYLGTDDRGRDVLARLIYGFRISMIFGLSLAVFGTLIGCLIGGIQGFFGGLVDLIGQRLTEIWGSIPRLYILIILSSFFVPSILLLFAILNLTAWMGIAAYIRAEFLKIRSLEFVKAAKAMGVSNFKIMRRHILPNALTPVVTFFPFEVTAGILALVSLDYLNLGVPSPAPSLGELLAQGKNNLHALWILLPTFTVLTVMITCLTFVGEGVRNAFDPRKSA